MNIIIIKVVKIVWIIEGIENHGFGNDKKLYNLIRCKEKRQTINSGCVGYWIDKKFYTIERLKPLLKRPDNFDVPF